MSKLESKALDEDADVDESDDWDAEAIEVWQIYITALIGPNLGSCLHNDLGIFYVLYSLKQKTSALVDLFD